MAVIPTSLITDGVLNAEGCALINCPSTSGTAASAAAVNSTLLDLSGAPGTTYAIGTSTRARVVMQMGHGIIAITSTALKSTDSIFITVNGLNPDSNANVFSCDFTQIGSHEVDIVANSSAAADVTLDLFIVRN